ncbi:MAG: hypothetical protein U9R74_13680 [Pseudomonadota bacterium]|nr:hypothetical protein [Pseudomonadota bacterium]
MDIGLVFLRAIKSGRAPFTKRHGRRLRSRIDDVLSNISELQKALDDDVLQGALVGAKHGVKRPSVHKEFDMVRDVVKTVHSDYLAAFEAGRDPWLLRYTLLGLKVSLRDIDAGISPKLQGKERRDFEIEFRRSLQDDMTRLGLDKHQSAYLVDELWRHAGLPPLP